MVKDLDLRVGRNGSVDSGRVKGVDFFYVRR